MFKITPVQNIDLAKKYAKICGTNAKDGAFVYAMIDTDTEDLMAISQFEITKDYGYIYDIVPVPELDDFEAMFILGRQTMNFIDLCGVHVCKAECTATDEKLLLAIGFRKINGEFICDMTGFFDGTHCSGHK